MIGTALLASVFILTTSCGINENTASSSVPPQNKTDTNISENTTSSDTSVKKKQEQTSPLKDSGTVIDKTQTTVNETICVTPKISGGTSPYRYIFSYKSDNGVWTDQKEMTGRDFHFRMPSKPCIYTLRMEVHDANENVITKMFNISVSQTTNAPLKPTSLHLSAEYVCSGSNNLHVTAQFTGGTPPYQYKYSCIDPQDNETELKDFSYSDSPYLKLQTSPGKYTIRVTAQDSKGNTAYTDKTLNSVTYLPVKNIYQYSYPTLPTGCEITSLAICLNYDGFDVSKNDLAENYLSKGYFEFRNEEKYGPDPNHEFAGDPNSEQSYGCYSGCIAETANRYFQSVHSGFTAKSQNGKELEELFQYLEQGKPVMVWTTIRLSETYICDTWKTEDGTIIDWPINEHCVVLTGYDKDNHIVYVADPLCDTEDSVVYDMELFRQKYNEIKQYAAVIYQ